jgi:hypothetical protein
MTKTRKHPVFNAHTKEWVFENGKRLPLVSGGDPTATTTEVVVPGAVQSVEGDQVEPVTPPQNQPAPGDGVFTKADIEAAMEKARQQEKEKLYPRLEKMSEQLNAFAQEREEAQRLAREAAEREAEERRRAEEEEMSVKDLLTRKEDEWKQTLNTAQQEWEQKFNALQQESEARQALLDQERRFQELSSYRNRRIQEENENIMPQLLDLVTGNSEEEIEESIQRAVAKTADIVGSVQGVVEASQSQRPRGIPATGGGPSGPLENATEQQVLTPAMIAGMSMDEYAKVRERLLATTSRR